MSSIATSKFGTGFIPEGETSKFVFTGGQIFDEKEGAGGAVPVRGYVGPWPVFGKSEDSWEQQHDTGWDVGIGSSSSGGSSQSDSSSSSSSSDISAAPIRRPQWVCKPTGTCSACPVNELHRPYCQPYGNRVPIECRPVTVLAPSTKRPIDRRQSERSDIGISEAIGIDALLLSRQETIIGSDIYKGYQVCGRDQVKESWDFAGFVGFNLVFALVGLFVFLQRQRLLAGQHQSMLARRIGRI